MLRNFFTVFFGLLLEELMTSLSLLLKLIMNLDISFLLHANLKGFYDFMLEFTNICILQM